MQSKIDQSNASLWGKNKEDCRCVQLVSWLLSTFLTLTQSFFYPSFFHSLFPLSLHYRFPLLFLLLLNTQAGNSSKLSWEEFQFPNVHPQHPLFCSNPLRGKKRERELAILAPLSLSSIFLVARDNRVLAPGVTGMSAPMDSTRSMSHLRRHLLRLSRHHSSQLSRSTSPQESTDLLLLLLPSSLAPHPWLHCVHSPQLWCASFQRILPQWNVDISSSYSSQHIHAKHAKLLFKIKTS